MEGEVRTRSHPVPQSQHEIEKPAIGDRMAAKARWPALAMPLNEPAIALMYDLLADPGARVFPVHKCRAWPPRRS